MFDKIFLFIINYYLFEEWRLECALSMAERRKKKNKCSSNSKELKCVSVAARRLSKWLQFLWTKY